MNHAQKSRCPEAQMSRCPDAQKPRSPDAQKPRCPNLHQSRTTLYNSNFNFKNTFFNDRCSQVYGPDLAIKSKFCPAFSKIQEEIPHCSGYEGDTAPDIYLGMSCDYLVDFAGGLMSLWDVPLVSVGSRDNKLRLGRTGIGDFEHAFVDLHKNFEESLKFISPSTIPNLNLNTLIRIGPSALHLQKALNSFLNHFNYTTIAVISQEPNSVYDGPAYHSSPVEEHTPYDCDIFGESVYRHFSRDDEENDSYKVKWPFRAFWWSVKNWDEGEVREFLRIWVFLGKKNFIFWENV